ncbi:MAG TPA: hypothetical protein VGH24_08835 [Solirubrobacteraceae bacterium]
MRDRLRARLLGGAVDSNEWLTTATGILLVVLLAVLGITIIWIGQLIWLHLFLGLLLMGPVALKMASTGYRFARYYTRDDRYVERGPPLLPLRVIAPAVVLLTVIVFASGIVLLFEGPRSRGTWLTIHKVSFIAWIAFTAVHVLGHLPEVGRILRIPRSVAREPALAGGDGAAGRWIAIAGALVAGAVLAIVLIPDFGVWTAHGALAHHHHG